MARLAVAAEQVVRAGALLALARGQQEAAAGLQVQSVLREQLGAGALARHHALHGPRARARLQQEPPARGPGTLVGSSHGGAAGHEHTAGTAHGSACSKLQQENPARRSWMAQCMAVLPGLGSQQQSLFMKHAAVQAQLLAGVTLCY